MADKHHQEYLKQNPEATIEEKKADKPNFIEKMN